MEALMFSRADVEDIAGHYHAIEGRIPLHPIRTEAEYETLVSVMNGLVDAGLGNENHSLAGLLGLIGSLIGDYEDANHAMPDVPPAEVVRQLMDQHGLKQGDLPEIGSQGVVSEVLSGKRELNTGQIRRLSQRFGVGPLAFM